MLTSIVTTWPPAPGPQQTQTGTKTQQGKGLVEMSLADLHTPAWWTGIRLTTVVPTGFYVRLLKGDGSSVFDLATEDCTWIQNTGSWVQFPWAIPAAMAKALDMKLRIQTVGGSEPHVSVTVCFHELQMPVKDNYLFMNARRELLQVWNGTKLQDGTPDRGMQPVWHTIHYVVPPMRLLPDWDDTMLFCIHNWNELVHLPEL